MNWKIFDKIFVSFNNNYQQLKSITLILKNNYKITDFSNVEICFKPHNKITENIYDILRKNKIVIDWYNSQTDGDFLGKDDFCSTLYYLNIIKRCYLLNYNKILFFNEHAFNGGLHKSKKIYEVLDNFPVDFNGFVYLNYKNDPEKRGECINEYYFDCEWSKNLKNIGMYAISRNGMKNILDNQSMILKTFDYYLLDRYMPYDSLVKHIALDKNKC